MARQRIDGFHLRKHGGRLWNRDEISENCPTDCEICGEHVDVLFYSYSTNHVQYERRCIDCLEKYKGPEDAIPKGQYHPYSFPNGYTWKNGKKHAL